MIFFAFLASGGNPIFPKALLYVGFALPAMLLRYPSAFFRSSYRHIWLFLGAFVIVALISLLQEAGGGIVGRLVAIVGGLLLLLVYAEERKSRFAVDALPILRLFAIQAILTFILSLATPFLFTEVSLHEGDSATSYRTIFFLFTYHDVQGVQTFLKRPDGFFWEPGVFQIYLNIFLYISLFMSRRPIDAGLALVALVTLQSTTGLIIASLLCVAYAIRKWAIATPPERFLLVFLGPVLLGPTIVITSINTSDKLVGETRGSAVARQFDAEAGLGVIANNPVSGVGLDSDVYRKEMMRYSDPRSELNRARLGARTTSNGVLELAGMAGIPFALIFLWGLFRQRLFRRKILFGTIIFLAFLTEPLIMTPFFMFIVLSGMLVPRLVQFRRSARGLKPRPENLRRPPCTVARPQSSPL